MKQSERRRGACGGLWGLSRTSTPLAAGNTGVSRAGTRSRLAAGKAPSLRLLIAVLLALGPATVHSFQVPNTDAESGNKDLQVTRKESKAACAVGDTACAEQDKPGKRASTSQKSGDKAEKRVKGGPVHHPHPSSTSGKKDTSIKRKTSSQEKTSAPSTVGPEKSLRSAKESSPPSLRDEKRVLSRVAAATSTTATVIGIEVEMPVAGDEEGSASQEVASHPKNLEPIKVTKDLSQELKNTEPYEHCDPVNEEDRCSYVRSVNECFVDNKLVAYLEILYCSAQHTLVKVTGLVVWMIVLFYALGQVADHFLCPALKMISERMQLPSDVAGITLLAFANGAPDIFTELAAITSGDHVDMGLALSVTLGAGLCICVVVFSVIVLIKPQQITQANKAAYLRDSGTYLITCVLVVAFMWDGKFSFSEAITMLSVYVAYISSAIITYQINLLSGRGKTPVGAIPSKILSGDLSHSSCSAGLEPMVTTSLQPHSWKEEYFSWSHITPWEKALGVIVLPIKLLLHVTMPVLRPGVVSERYAVVLCTIAPLFSTLVLAVTPQTVGFYSFLLTWISGSLLLMLALHLKVDRVEGKPVCSNWLFTFIAFFQCILWMNFLADELVALFHAMGHALGVSQALIGGTVLAWGECTADLIASLAIARSGKSNMALAACFGCPILNMLGGMGAGLLYQTITVGPVHTKVSNGVFTLAIVSIALVFYQTVAVPLLHKWNLSRFLAFTLLSMYAVSQVAFIGIEGQFFSV